MNISSISRKENGSIDSIQVNDIEETITNLKSIGVEATKSNEYEDEIDIQNVQNKTKFKEWLRTENYKLAVYPRLRNLLSY